MVWLWKRPKFNSRTCWECSHLWDFPFVGKMTDTCREWINLCPQVRLCANKLITLDNGLKCVYEQGPNLTAFQGIFTVTACTLFSKMEPNPPQRSRKKCINFIANYSTSKLLVYRNYLLYLHTVTLLFPRFEHLFNFLVLVAHLFKARTLWQTCFHFSVHLQTLNIPKLFTLP